MEKTADMNRVRVSFLIDSLIDVLLAKAQDLEQIVNNSQPENKNEV